MTCGIQWKLFVLLMSTAAVYPQSLLPVGGGSSADSSSVAASTDLPDLPDAPEAVFSRHGDRSGVKVEYQTNMRRFSRLALALNAGINGIGMEVATPLSNKWNLRAGVGLLGGSYTFTVSSSTASSSFGATLPGNAIDVSFQPHFRSVMAAADWFPRYGSFRISPGITLYNGNRATILATVEGGQQIDVGSGTYTSDPNDPIRAVLQTHLGRVVAPRLTVGWGNMIPRAGQHFSFPFEIGVEYVGKPQITLALTGSECDSDGLCFPLSVDPGTQANVADEQKQLNDDIAPLRFYPILSTGISYRF